MTQGGNRADRDDVVGDREIYGRKVLKMVLDQLGARVQGTSQYYRL